MIACFIGAAVGATMVFGIGAMKKGGFSPLRIVLAGAAVSAFLFAVRRGSVFTSRYQKMSRCGLRAGYRNFLGAASSHRSVHYNRHPDFHYLF